MTNDANAKPPATALDRSDVRVKHETGIGKEPFGRSSIGFALATSAPFRSSSAWSSSGRSSPASTRSFCRATISSICCSTARRSASSSSALCAS